MSAAAICIADGGQTERARREATRAASSSTVAGRRATQVTTTTSANSCSCLAICVWSPRMCLAAGSSFVCAVVALLISLVVLRVCCSLRFVACCAPSSVAAAPVVSAESVSVVLPQSAEPEPAVSSHHIIASQQRALNTSGKPSDDSIAQRPAEADLARQAASIARSKAASSNAINHSSASEPMSGPEKHRQDGLLAQHFAAWDHAAFNHTAGAGDTRTIAGQGSTRCCRSRGPAERQGRTRESSRPAAVGLGAVGLLAPGSIPCSLVCAVLGRVRLFIRCDPGARRGGGGHDSLRPLAQQQSQHSRG